MALGKTPVQTVRADFPHTAYRWSLVRPHYADPGYWTVPRRRCKLKPLTKGLGKPNPGAEATALAHLVSSSNAQRHASFGEPSRASRSPQRDLAVAPPRACRTSVRALLDAALVDEATAEPEAIVDLCEAYGVALDPARHSYLASLDLDGLAALRLALKRLRAWP